MDLGEELEVGGVVGGGGVKGDVGEEAGGEAGDGCAGGVEVGGEGGGADEAGVDDVALGLRWVGSGEVAVAEEMEQVGGGHGERWWTLPLYRAVGRGVIP